MKHRIIATLVAATTLFASVAPVSVSASVFDPGLIISEQELFNQSTMSVEDIQRFLDSHEGVLKNHVDIDVDGLLKTAAMIIADASARHSINPQYLLVLLQKEQGLITDPDPKDTQIAWATGYAACDTCDVDHPVIVKFKGFPKQVDRAAWRTRYFVEHPDEFFYKPGQTYQISGEDVLLKNPATAALYNYTPHINGNRILWKLYISWFRPTTHPDGSLLQAVGEPGVWLIQQGRRHPFTNSTAFTSRYKASQIIAIDKGSLEKYQIGAPISYPEYALIRTPDDKTYLLVGKQKRLIANSAAFRLLGFSPDEVEEGTEASLAFFEEGLPITETSTQPLGALLQDPQSYGVFYVLDGIKYPLMAPELLSLNFPQLRVRKATQEELDRYVKGAPVLLQDGLLVKAPQDPRVYVIANGKKLPIYSEYTFNSLGYHWSNISAVSQRLLDLHPTGDLLRVEPLTDEEISQSADLAQQLP